MRKPSKNRKAVKASRIISRERDLPEIGDTRLARVRPLDMLDLSPDLFLKLEAGKPKKTITLPKFTWGKKDDR